MSLTYGEIRELTVGSLGRTDNKHVRCHKCMSGLPERENRSEEFFLCFSCEIYVCPNCFSPHKRHLILGLNQTNKLQWMNRLREAMLQEIEKGQEFYEEKNGICDRIVLSHELDIRRDCCGITSLCVLDGNQLAVCDTFNYCIKIIDLNTNTIKRYIRFSEKPSHLTVVLENTGEGRTACTANRNVLAMASNYIVWIVDVSHTPALKTRAFKLDKICSTIRHFEDKYYVGCSEYPASNNAFLMVYIVSMQGTVLKQIETMIRGAFIALRDNKIYLTDKYNDSIKCIDDNGKVITQSRIDGATPRGVDTDENGRVFVCARRHNKIYRLGNNLVEYTSITTDATPNGICVFGAKYLFAIGHQVETW